MSTVFNGFLLQDDGRLSVSPGSGAVSGATVHGGIVRTATGELACVELGGTAVPGTATDVQWFKVDSDLRAQVTTESPDSTDVYRGGLRFRADGALRITSDSVAADDAIHGGIAVAQTGEVRTVGVL